MRRSAVVFCAMSVACGDTGGGPDAAESDAGALPDGQIRTSGGIVEGVRAGDTWAYLGVPFVAPPVGALRFAPPAPVVPWDGVRDASAFGPRCPQLEEGAVVGDEDCLRANVWVPDAGDASRPVMVWIHGGGNSIGSATDPLYDGARLAAAGGVVLISIDYRLGQLGFLAHAALGDDAGNWGLLDLVAGLAWARDNAAAFGGDPDRVTIFGESAGGRDVCALLATPAAAGLFDRAIVQSGACKFLEPLAEAAAFGVEVAAAAGCGGADVVACLRDAEVATIVEALPSEVGTLSRASYGPTVGGETLPEQPEAAIRAGRHHDVPLIVGANSDETGREAPLSMTQEQYEAAVRAMLGPTLGELALDEYAGVSPPRDAYVRLTSDARFICPSREIARAADEGGDAGARRYFFRHAAGPFGAVHGLELVYLFGNFEAIEVGGEPYQPTATDLAISVDVQRRWTDFAKGDVGDWPAWSDVDPALAIDDATAIVDGAGAERCDFWRPFYEAL